MLAGCSSSTLLSPRHRLRSEAPAQFQASHFQLPSMSTQRLDLPCSFSRKESSQRPQPMRPVGVGLSVDKSLESKTSGCSLKQNIRLPPLATSNHHHHQSVKDEFWEEKGKSLKRFAEQGSIDDSRNKRKRGSSGGESGNFWFQAGFEVPRTTTQTQTPFSLTCSGDDEENVCFMPSEVISPPLPLSNNPWLDSVITEITDLAKKEGQSSQRPTTEASGSSPSSDSHSHSYSLGLTLSENIAEHEVGNGSRNPYPYPYPREVPTEENQQQEEYQAFELVSLLTACVEAIGSRNIAVINHCIAKLGDLATPKGGTPVSRLCAYYTEAIALRVTRLWPQFFYVTPPREYDRADDDSGASFRLLNQVTPIPKFIHFTSNEIILRAFEGKDRVHIIDFDIKQGLQWPSLFQSLASRSNPPSHVRITGIGESKQELNETGDRLAGFAEALNLPFEFHPVVDRLEDVRLWMLHVKEGESVAVNSIFQMHKTLYDSNGVALRDFLGLVRSTNPVIVTMAEQEAENNAPYFDNRFCNSLKFYSAIFDSIGSGLPRDSAVRAKIEEMFAREIRNIVACEGSERFERHEKFEKWRKLMEQGGFRSAGITEREMVQSQMLLKMYSSMEDFSVERRQDGVALTLSWLDESLYTVSGWVVADVAGSSS